MNEAPQQIPNQQPAEQPIPQVPIQPEQPVISPQQPKTNWPILILVLVLAVVSYAGVAYWQGMWPFSPSEEAMVEESPTPTSQNQNYQNYSGLGFSVKYPKTWVVKGSVCSKILNVASTESDCLQLSPIEALDYYKQKYDSDFLILLGVNAVINTDKTLKEFLDMTIGAESVGSKPFAEEKEIIIDGQPGVRIKNAIENSYTTYYYAAKKQSTIIFLSFRSYSKAYPPGKPVMIDDFSQYLPDVELIVKSMKFN